MLSTKKGEIPLNLCGKWLRREGGMEGKREREGGREREKEEGREGKKEGRVDKDHVCGYKRDGW